MQVLSRKIQGYVLIIVGQKTKTRDYFGPWHRLFAKP